MDKNIKQTQLNSEQINLNNSNIKVSEKQVNYSTCEESLNSYCKLNNINLTEDIKQKLRVYYELLVDWNEKINLTAITNLEPVYEKHFADSISSVKYLKTNTTLCDIGTGAGFPGLVIAIFRPDIKVVLVDALQKRVNFLNEVINQLNLNNVEVLHHRAEDEIFKTKYLNSFDYVVSRAVARLNTLIEYCLPFVKIGGEFIAYKSEKSEEEIKECNNSLKLLGGASIKIEEYKLSEFFRCLLFIKKKEKTSNKYPRGQNKPRLKPL